MIYAAVRSGMSEREFWESSLTFIYAKIHANTEAFRDKWEQTRFVAYVMAKTVDSKKRIRKPADLLPFPWDAPAVKFAKITEEGKEALRKFDAEADLIMQKYQPEVWAQILKAREDQKNGID